MTKSNDWQIQHQVRHSELVTVVAMLALVLIAGIAFWYGSPSMPVFSTIHQIASAEASS